MEASQRAAGRREQSMNRMVIGLVVAAAGAVLLANAARRERQVQRALDEVALARWEDETASPPGYPDRTPAGPPRAGTAVA
jgi:uncharacterized membrane protein YidH (DUF202 family)